METIKSLLTELDCHTVFSTAILKAQDDDISNTTHNGASNNNTNDNNDNNNNNNNNPDARAALVTSLSSGLPMVEDAINCLDQYTLSSAPCGGKGQMALAMRSLALAGSVRRGEACARRVVERGWGGEEEGTVEERRRREKRLLADLLADDKAPEGPKRARAVAEEMADKVMGGGA